MATIGEVCTDERMKMAVANIFPNRPGWMGATGLAQPARRRPAGDRRRPDREDRQGRGRQAEARGGRRSRRPKPDPKKKKRRPKAKAPAKPEITEDTAADKQAFKDLQALVWPSGDKADQDKLLAAFNATVLQYYKGEDEKTLPGNDWKSHPKKTAKTGRKLRYGWKSARSGWRAPRRAAEPAPARRD